MSFLEYNWNVIARNNTVATKWKITRKQINLLIVSQNMLKVMSSVATLGKMPFCYLWSYSANDSPNLSSVSFYVFFSFVYLFSCLERPKYYVFLLHWLTHSYWREKLTFFSSIKPNILISVCFVCLGFFFSFSISDTIFGKTPLHQVNEILNYLYIRSK